MPVTLPLKKMSRNEKLMAMEALWADLNQDDSEMGSPAWHEEALRSTAQLVAAGKAKFMDWDKAKVILRRRAAKLA